MKSPQSNLGRAGAARGDRGNLDPVRTSVFFENKKIASAIYDRESLQPGKKYSGAAVVTEYSATTIVPPRAKFWLDRNRNLFIQLRP
jgi:N-methylhydantoinase A/oxoprolinase/acetone carboxylase beta subunit